MLLRTNRFAAFSLIFVPSLTLLSMFAYQWLKHVFTPDMSLWESHIYTNLFVTVAVTIVAFLLTRYLEMSSLLASIAESSVDGIVGTSIDGTVLAWNRGAEKIYGFSADEIVGKSLSLIIPPERPDEVSSLLKKIVRAERIDRHETVRIRKDGRRIYVSLTASPILDPAGGIIGASTTVRDITKRKMAEDALRDSKAALARAQAFSLIMFAHVGLDGRWLKVPESLCGLLGFSEEEMLRARFDDITHLDDIDRELHLRQCLASGAMKSAELEKRCSTRDGMVVWLDVNYSMVLDAQGKPGHFLVYLRDITKRKKAEEEVILYHSHLEELVESRTRALTEANEHLRNEILERRRAEQSLRESSDKFKFFAYSVIHDLKSPSVGIYGLTRRLHDCYGSVLDSKGKAYCDQILKASEHVADLIDEINTYISAKEVPLTIEDLETGQLLAALRSEFAERLNARGIQLIEPAASCKLRGDKSYLLRALRNLIDNAMKYGGSGLSEIRLGCLETSRFCLLSVFDNGVNLGTDDYEKLFEVFKRTKSSKDIPGSGLGLAIVKEIAERHGGIVWVEPEQEGGKTFYISICKAV